MPITPPSFNVQALSPGSLGQKKESPFAKFMSDFMQYGYAKDLQKNASDLRREEDVISHALGMERDLGTGILTGEYEVLPQSTPESVDYSYLAETPGLTEESRDFFSRLGAVVGSGGRPVEGVNFTSDAPDMNRRVWGDMSQANRDAFIVGDLSQVESLLAAYDGIIPDELRAQGLAYLEDLRSPNPGTSREDVAVLGKIFGDPGFRPDARAGAATEDKLRELVMHWSRYQDAQGNLVDPTVVSGLAAAWEANDPLRLSEAIGEFHRRYSDPVPGYDNFSTSLDNLTAGDPNTFARLDSTLRSMIESSTNPNAAQDLEAVMQEILPGSQFRVAQSSAPLAQSMAGNLPAQLVIFSYLDRGVRNPEMAAQFLHDYTNAEGPLPFTEEFYFEAINGLLHAAGQEKYDISAYRNAWAEKQGLPPVSNASPSSGTSTGFLGGPPVRGSDQPPSEWASGIHRYMIENLTQSPQLNNVYNNWRNNFGGAMNRARLSPDQMVDGLTGAIQNTTELLKNGPLGSNPDVEAFSTIIESVLAEVEVLDDVEEQLATIKNFLGL